MQKNENYFGIKCINLMITHCLFDVNNTWTICHIVNWCILYCVPWVSLTMLLFAVLYAVIFLLCHRFLNDGATFFFNCVYSMFCSFISVLCACLSYHCHGPWACHWNKVEVEVVTRTDFSNVIFVQTTHTVVIRTILPLHTIMSETCCKVLWMCLLRMIICWTKLFENWMVKFTLFMFMFPG